MVQSRSFGDIEFIAYSKNGTARLISDASELNFLVNLFVNIKSTLSFIISRSFRLGNPMPLILFSKIAAKKALGKEVNEEREALFSILEDISVVEIRMLGRSRKIMCSGTTFNLLWQVFVKNQYDVSEETIKGKVVVDVGSNIGDFAIFASFFAPTKIYAFEPLSRNFALLKSNIALNRLETVVEPVKLGLGDKELEADVDSGRDVNIGVGGSSPSAVSKERIRITTLDKFFGGRTVDFLKMDVEGYEENVLLGGVETIKGFKPILSFSAYHKPSDKTRLPEIVRGIRPDYVIELNSHYEEDFYCH